MSGEAIICPHCQAKLELEGTPQDWAGQEVECPKCGTKFPVPTGSENYLRCPSCKNPMPPNAVICVTCGFDLRTGQKVPTEPADQEPKKLRVKDRPDTARRQTSQAVGGEDLPALLPRSGGQQEAPRGGSRKNLLVPKVRGGSLAAAAVPILISLPLLLFSIYLVSRGGTDIQMIVRRCVACLLCPAGLVFLVAGLYRLRPGGMRKWISDDDGKERSPFVGVILTAIALALCSIPFSFFVAGDKEDMAAVGLVFGGLLWPTGLIFLIFGLSRLSPMAMKAVKAVLLGCIALVVLSVVAVLVGGLSKAWLAKNIPTTARIMAICVVPNVIPNVLSFDGWERTNIGYKGFLHFHGWAPGMGGATIHIRYKCYGKDGTVLGDGSINAPNLQKGEKGVVEMFGDDVKNADRIVITVE